MTLGVYSRANLGDVTCPSIEQLEGVVDPTDPCQAGSVTPINLTNSPAYQSMSSPTTGASPGGCYPAAFVGPIPPGGVLCPVSATAGCPSGSTCSIIAGVPDMAVYALGGILALFVIMGASGK
jgi:hypothetical protein